MTDIVVEKTTDTIDRAAIIFGTECWSLPRPARHHDIILDHWQKTGIRGSGEQGFIDSTGQYLSRKHAMYVARAAGQLIPRAGRDESIHDELFTEDMW